MAFFGIHASVMAQQILEFPLTNAQACLSQQFQVVGHAGIQLMPKNLSVIPLNRENGVRQPVQRARDVAAVHQLCADLAEHKTIVPKGVFGIAPQEFKLFLG